MDKLIRNTKINRVTLLVAGIIFMFYGLFDFFFIGIGIVLLLASYCTHKKYKELLKIKESSENKKEEL